MNINKNNSFTIPTLTLCNMYFYLKIIIQIIKHDFLFFMKKPSILL